MKNVKLEKYEQYKPDEVDWLDVFPAHWEVKRIKDLSALQSGDGVDSEQLEDSGLYPVYGGNGLRGYFSDYTNDGDYILIGRQGALCGNINYASGKFWATEHALVVYPKQKVNIKWYGEMLRVMNLNQYSISAAQPGLSVDRLRRLLLPIPPLVEQQAIADYLDTKTAQIDHKIDLLAQKAQKYADLKQSLINETVTRGLDQTVPMKDSEVYWINKIPSHWKLFHLKNCVSAKITDGPHDTPVFYENGVPFLSAEAVYNGKLNIESMRGYISEETDMLYAKKCKPRRNDIFIVKSGSTTGKVGYVDTEENFNIWSPLALVRVNKQFFSRYLFYFLTSSYFQKQVQISWSFGTQPNIGMGVIERLQVLCPPFEEQKAIAEYLESKTAHIERIIKTINLEIEKLKELRKTLINGVVTGKIKVYEA